MAVGWYRGYQARRMGLICIPYPEFQKRELLLGQLDPLSPHLRQVLPGPLDGNWTLEKADAPLIALG